MKKIVKDIEIPPFNNKLTSLYFGKGNIGFFDIETTGLSPKINKVILSGILEFDNYGNGKTIQLFADEFDDEKKILSETAEILSQFDVIVTYNGKSFDIPFILERMKKYNISNKLDTLGHLDLYRVIKSHSEIPNILPSLKQKNIEKFMGISEKRKDEISGQDSVKQYKQYMVTKSKDIEENILLHNFDDILQLGRLLPIINQTNFHEAMYNLGFPFENFLIEEINISSGVLNFKSKSNINFNDYIMFPTDEFPYRIQYISSSKILEVEIPCFEIDKGIYGIDAVKLLGNDNFEQIKRYPSFESGYLVIPKEIKDYSSINVFIMFFLRHITNKFLKENANDIQLSLF